MRHLHQLLAQVERRALAVEETRDTPAPQEADGLELLDRRVHRIEAARVQFEGAERADARHEEQEATTEVALAGLVLAASFRLADPAVVLAQHGLAATEQPHRSLATGVQRNGRMALAVAHPPIGRVLGPVATLARAPGRQFMGHRRLPMIRREHHREAVQVPSLATVLAVGAEQLLRERRVAEVLRPHGEPRHVAWDERVAQFGQGLGQQALNLIERLASGDTSLVDFAGTRLFGCGAGEDLDTRSNLPCSRDAGW